MKKISKKTIEAKKKKKLSSLPKSSGNLPATQKFVYGIREELIEKISSSSKRLESKIHDIKADIHDLRSEIHGIKADIHDLRSENHGIKAEIQTLRSEIQMVKADVHELKSQVQRMVVLVEEQTIQNKIALDHLAVLFERQDRVEKKLDQSL